MRQTNPTILLALIISLVPGQLWRPAYAEKLPTAGEFIQYFNPLQPKAYLNESQDRLIKKQVFQTSKFPGFSAIANRDIGLFASLDAREAADETIVEALLDRPNTSGIACVFPWQQLEPSEGSYNFAVLDRLLQQCSRHGKSLILSVSTCGSARDSTTDSTIDQPSTAKAAPFVSVPKSGDAVASDTPAWVFAAGVKYLDYRSRGGIKQRMPIYWDLTYLAKWSNFVQELGRRYDKNPALGSIGITGGGVFASTAILPGSTDDNTTESLSENLVKDFGMKTSQIVSHWKYVADIFPKAFPTARLIFDIDPPLPGHKGQECLDEITDYLIYRYGERIYLVRQNVNAKHGFDQYRLIVKFRADTLTGYQLSDSLDDDTIAKIVKYAGDDGASFAIIPAELFAKDKTDKALCLLLEDLRSRLGYQLISQSVKVPAKLKAGDSLKASFRFVNLGAATLKRPSRELDRDVPASYRVQLKLVASDGKAAAISRHTPPIPTTQWSAGKEIAWEKDLKMPKVVPGVYSIWMSVVDDESRRKIQVMNETADSAPKATFDIPVGQIQITP